MAKAARILFLAGATQRAWTNSAANGPNECVYAKEWLPLKRHSAAKEPLDRLNSRALRWRCKEHVPTAMFLLFSDSCR